MFGWNYLYLLYKDKNKSENWSLTKLIPQLILWNCVSPNLREKTNLVKFTHVYCYYLHIGMYSFKKPQNLKLLSTKLRYMLFLAQKFEDENLSKKIFSAEAEFCEIDPWSSSLPSVHSRSPSHTNSTEMHSPLSQRHSYCHRDQCFICIYLLFECLSIPVSGGLDS
jgi:hypothetical protein